MNVYHLQADVSYLLIKFSLVGSRMCSQGLHPSPSFQSSNMIQYTSVVTCWLQPPASISYPSALDCARPWGVHFSGHSAACSSSLGPASLPWLWSWAAFFFLIALIFDWGLPALFFLVALIFYCGTPCASTACIPVPLLYADSHCTFPCRLGGIWVSVRDFEPLHPSPVSLRMANHYTLSRAPSLWAPHSPSLSCPLHICALCLSFYSTNTLGFQVPARLLPVLPLTLVGSPV
jgi:hypothetical protein